MDKLATKVYDIRPKKKEFMQMDMFEETLTKKINRMEKWIGRLQKEMYFLKEVYNLSQRQSQFREVKKKIEQIEMFGG